MQWLWEWLCEKLRGIFAEKDPSVDGRRSLSIDGMMSLLVNEDWWLDTII